MKPLSLFLIIVTTMLGAWGMFVMVEYGLNASDPYASRISTRRPTYRPTVEAPVVTGGEISERSSVPANSPANNENSGSPRVATNQSNTNTPQKRYIRPDSDQVKKASNSEPASNNRPAKNSQQTANNQAASNAINTVMIATEGDDASETNQPQSASGESALSSSGITNNSGDQIIQVRNFDSTMNGQIERQLASNNISDRKREALESLLAQSGVRSVRAIDVRLQFNSRTCNVPRNSNSWIGIKFRRDTAAIRGASLDELDGIIALRKLCKGELIIEDYPGAISDSDLKHRSDRHNEITQYLLQQGVPEASVQIGNL